MADVRLAIILSVMFGPFVCGCICCCIYSCVKDCEDEREWAEMLTWIDEREERQSGCRRAQQLEQAGENVIVIEPEPDPVPVAVPVSVPTAEIIIEPVIEAENVCDNVVIVTGVLTVSDVTEV
jgi:hypothetical protein